jgi:hypothetical protein
VTTLLLVLGIWFALSCVTLGGLVAFWTFSEWLKDRDERRAWETELGRRLTRGEKAALRIFNGRKG